MDPCRSNIGGPVPCDPCGVDAGLEFAGGSIGVGDGGHGGRAPLKFGRKYFSANYYVKFGHFSSKNHVKFGNFVNFSGKYHKNSGILVIFRARIM